MDEIVCVPKIFFLNGDMSIDMSRANSIVNPDPTDLSGWIVENVFSDTIWLEFADTDKEGNISRGGIVIPEGINANRHFFRIARVLKHGPDCSDCIKEGVFVLVPPIDQARGIKPGAMSGAGLPGVTTENIGPNGFFREDAIMCVIKRREE